MSNPIGYVLRCKDAKLGDWIDFRESPAPGWIPVVPQDDDLIAQVDCVQRTVVGGWAAYIGTPRFTGVGPTPRAACQDALRLMYESRKAEEEIELW